jgi:hypothetical protein
VNEKENYQPLALHVTYVNSVYKEGKKAIGTYILIREFKVLSDLVFEIADGVAHTHSHRSAGNKVTDVGIQIGLNVTRKGSVGRSLVV